MKVEIDLRKTISDNAAEYYRKSKKAKGKISGGETALSETRAKIKKVRSSGVAEEKKTGDASPVKKRKKRWFEKFRNFISSDGLLVVGGRDATSNEILIKKHTEGGDIVFHANIQGAAFIVVKNQNGQEIPEATKKEAAQAAAAYSSGWRKGLGSVDVYMIEPSQLSKTPESGEYLAKGAFVVRGERTWFNSTPLQVAVGFDGGKNEVVGGPASSVTSKTRYYVVVVPGDLKSSDLAKEVKKVLSRKTDKETGRKLKKASLDEIQKVLPAGPGKISERLIILD